MTDEGPNDSKVEIRGISRAMAAGIGAAGTLAGTGLGAFVGGVLPMKTFEWIIERGLTGFLIVSWFLMMVLYLREKQGRYDDNRRHHVETRGDLTAQAATQAQVAVALVESKAADVQVAQALRDLLVTLRELPDAQAAQALLAAIRDLEKLLRQKRGGGP